MRRDTDPALARRRAPLTAASPPGVLAAVRARPGFAAERWTFLVVTDHGHRDEGGHGGRTRWERTAWLAACGAGIGPQAPTGVSHVSVAPTVLDVLGQDLRHESHLAGVSLLVHRPAAPSAAVAAVPAPAGV